MRTRKYDTVVSPLARTPTNAHPDKNTVVIVFPAESLSDRIIVTRPAEGGGACELVARDQV